MNKSSRATILSAIARATPAPTSVSLPYDTAVSIHNGLWNTSYKSQDSEYGLFYSGGSVGVHVENPKFVSFDSNNSKIALASTSNKEDMLLRANGTDGSVLFTMYNDGKMSRFTLQRQLAEGNVTAPVVFASGDNTLPSPDTYPDEIVIITNITGNDIKLNVKISYEGKQYNPMTLHAFSSAMFICDGVEYYNTNFKDALSAG